MEAGTMVKVFDVIVEILKREGTEFLSCFPTNPIIDAAAAADLRPIVCRQERIGVGIADGYSRVNNGKRIGVFAMQYGPGAENAFAGVATAYSDSSPILLLPWGHSTEWDGLTPVFSATRTYAPITKWLERVNLPSRIPEIMRRAYSRLRMGRPGPVLLETPLDVAVQEVREFTYQPVKATISAGNPDEVDRAAHVLLSARCPIIHAGQGVLYAEAWNELKELAELLQIPVMTTLAGKSAFPEDHPLSLGTGSVVVTGPVAHFLKMADVVLGIGCSFSRHYMSTKIPSGKTIIHATNDEKDINQYCVTDYPIIGDARLILRQIIEAVKDRLGNAGQLDRGNVAQEIKQVKDNWLRTWMLRLTSDEIPINPYRIVWELSRMVDSKKAIITHDAGSPRNQLVPFYQAVEPRSYIGWGKSHSLGTGLGLIMGAKLARPEKIAINIMGDAAFGMVGTDFETAVRNRIPIITMVFKNSTMASEIEDMPVAHERYGCRDLTGSYADMGCAMGGYSQRVERPDEIVPAIQRAIRVTEEEKLPALLEFISSVEGTYSVL